MCQSKSEAVSPLFIHGPLVDRRRRVIGGGGPGDRAEGRVSRRDSCG